MRFCILFLSQTKMSFISTNTTNLLKLVLKYDPKTCNILLISSEKLTDSIPSIEILKHVDPYTSIINYEVHQCQVNTNEYNLNEIKLIGHRGHGMDIYNTSNPLGLVRENTIDSFMMAHNKNAQMVEMDIHLTKDEILVVYHDIIVDGKAIGEMNTSEFLQATKSTEDGFRSTNTTLKNILDHLPNELGLYLEIKYDGDIYKNTDYEIKTILSIIKLLKNYPRKKIMFASFSSLICALLKAYCPKYKVCLLVGKEEIHKLESEDQFKRMINEFLKIWKINGIVIDGDIVEKIIGYCKGKSEALYLMCYGDKTNEIRSIKRLKEMGVDGFCTDIIDNHFIH
jgi:glycerophosphoryl diester phosphodiesterase